MNSCDVYIVAPIAKLTCDEDKPLGSNIFKLHEVINRIANRYNTNAVSKYNNGNYIGAYQDFNMTKCIAEKNNMNGLVKMIDVYLKKLRERSI